MLPEVRGISFLTFWNRSDQRVILTPLIRFPFGEIFMFDDYGLRLYYTISYVAGGEPLARGGSLGSQKKKKKRSASAPEGGL